MTFSHGRALGRTTEKVKHKHRFKKYILGELRVQMNTAVLECIVLQKATCKRHHNVNIKAPPSREGKDAVRVRVRGVDAVGVRYHKSVSRKLEPKQGTGNVKKGKRPGKDIKTRWEGEGRRYEQENGVKKDEHGRIIAVIIISACSCEQTKRRET